MFIQKFGTKYAVVDRNDREICRFDKLSSACLVQRYLNNQYLPENESAKALRLIQEFDESEGGKGDS